MRHPAYVINRACDTARLEQFSKSAGQWPLDVEVVEAVDGHAPEFSVDEHAHLLRNGWNGRQMVKPGALACTLSHMDVWRRIRDGSASDAFVFEDDALVIRSPEAIEPLRGKADLVFVNRRAASWVEGAGPVRIPEAYAHKFRTAGDDDMPSRSLGSEGYWLSQAGAAALLGHVERHGACCGVDFFIVSAALPPDAIPDPLPDAFADRPALRIIRRISKPTPVMGWFLGDWLVEPLGDSVVGHDIRVPISGSAVVASKLDGGAA